MSLIKEEIKTEDELFDSSQDPELQACGQAKFEYVEVKEEADSLNWKACHSGSREPTSEGAHALIYDENSISKRNSLDDYTQSEIHDAFSEKRPNATPCSGEHSQKRTRTCRTSSPYVALQRLEDYPTGSKDDDPTGRKDDDLGVSNEERLSKGDLGIEDEDQEMEEELSENTKLSMASEENPPKKPRLLQSASEINAYFEELSENSSDESENEWNLDVEIHEPGFQLIELDYESLKEYETDEDNPDEQDEVEDPILENAVDPRLVRNEEAGVNQPDAEDIGPDIDVRWEEIVDGNFAIPDNPRPNFAPSELNFNNNQVPGFQWNASEPKPTSVLGWFQLFMTDEILQKTVDETNRYNANQMANGALAPNSRWHNWIDLTLEELKAFFGLVVNMGIINLPEITRYWSTKPNLNIPYFTNVMKRDRFLQIFSRLHPPMQDDYNDVPQAGSKIFKIIESFNERCKQLYVPRKEIAIDESMVLFKGKFIFKQYCPLKPTKYGVKFFSMVDSSNGFMYYVVPYLGPNTIQKLDRPDLPPTNRLVYNMCNYLKNNTGGQGYHIFTDRFYSGVQLSLELLGMNFYHTGTVNLNRVCCKEFKDKSSQLGYLDVVAYHYENKLLAVTWKDKREVTLITSYYHVGHQVIERRISKKLAEKLEKMRQQVLRCEARANQPVRGRGRGRGAARPIVNSRYIQNNGVPFQQGDMQVIEKPTLICNHTKYMGGVERADHYCNSYAFDRKSTKYWRKVFFWILDLCICNAHILYIEDLKSQGKNIKNQSRINFRSDLVTELVRNYVPPARPRGQRSRNLPRAPTLQRLDNTLHVLAKQKLPKKCVVCSTTEKRVRSLFFCKTCLDKPTMCPCLCYEKYHTKQNFMT